MVRECTQESSGYRLLGHGKWLKCLYIERISGPAAGDFAAAYEIISESVVMLSWETSIDDRMSTGSEFVAVECLPVGGVSGPLPREDALDAQNTLSHSKATRPL